MPLIKKQNIDLDKIELLSYLKTKNNDEENKNKTIHFFTYDWNFESVYEKPEQSLEKLDQYYALLTPEFSTYKDMPLARQIDSVFKNRWWVHFGKNKECLLFQQSHGARMIVLISFAMVLKKAQLWLSQPTQEKITKRVLLIYEIMMEKIKPSAVICYGTPFEEMTGNIKAIDPYNSEKLIQKIGFEEFTRKYLAGQLYPEI